MDIDHLGEKIIAQLVEKGFVKRLSDLYRLTPEKLGQLKNFKEKAIQNVLSSIEKSKDVSLSRFIMALGIKHVGAETADLLAHKAKNLETLAKMTKEELLAIDGIGEKMAESILEFFADPENVEEIYQLLLLGVKPKMIEIKGMEGHPFLENPLS